MVTMALCMLSGCTTGPEGLSAMFGADMKPVKQLSGQYGRVEWNAGEFSGTPTKDHQVAFGAEYKLDGGSRQLLTFAFAGTNEGEAACERDYRVLAGDPVGDPP